MVLALSNPVLTVTPRGECRLAARARGASRDPRDALRPGPKAESGPCAARWPRFPARSRPSISGPPFPIAWFASFAARVRIFSWSCAESPVHLGSSLPPRLPSPPSHSPCATRLPPLLPLDLPPSLPRLLDLYQRLSPRSLSASQRLAPTAPELFTGPRRVAQISPVSRHPRRGGRLPGFKFPSRSLASLSR